MDYEMDISVADRSELDGYGRIDSKRYAEYFLAGKEVAAEVIYSSVDESDIYIYEKDDGTISRSIYNELIDNNAFFLYRKDKNGGDDTVTFFYAKYED